MLTLLQVPRDYPTVEAALAAIPPVLSQEYEIVVHGESGYWTASIGGKTVPGGMTFTVRLNK